MSLENQSSLHPSCQHINARGHRCRMLAAPPRKSSADEPQPLLCPYHSARRTARAALPDPEALARELLRGVHQFSDAASVNRFLGNLLRQVARRRIPRRDALALAYISQLLINTLSPLQKERDDQRDTEAGHLLLQYVADARAARRARENSSEDQPRDEPLRQPS